MTTEQALKLERRQRELNMGDGQLMDLARKAAADETLVHLGNLTRTDAADLLALMDAIVIADAHRQRQPELVGAR